MTVRSDLPLDKQVEELKQQIDELQKQIVQSQKLSSVGALASSITHEFNNILTTTINYAKMGLRHKDNATREKAFNKILSAGQRASKITTGMLSYARNNSDRREPTDLVVMVEDVLVLVEKDLQMHRVRCQTDYYDHPVVTLNASQIQQVLLNLIINARQAMDGGGQLVIAVRKNSEAGMAEISVKDTGGGIPAEKLRKIFEPFFSTKTADKQGQGGTGLGLALCRDIIEAHKGRIRVESTVGSGTTFTLKFPLDDESADTADAERSLAHVENGERVVLDKAVILIGRHPDCDLVLEDSRKVSRRHCCIAQVNDVFIVRDLGSMNGVRINGTRVEKEMQLDVGDEVAFGDVRYILESRESVKEPKDEAPPQPEPTPQAADEFVARPTPRPQPPVDLSQKFPVPIDDEQGEEFAVEPSLAVSKPVSPIFDDDVEFPIIEENDSEQDDVVLLEDSGEQRDPGNSRM
eukprot:g26576.t1